MPASKRPTPTLSAADRVAAMRARSLARIRQPFPTHIILDPTLLGELRELRGQLIDLERIRAGLEEKGDLPPASLAGGKDGQPPAAHIDRLIEQCREAIASVEADAVAADQVLVLTFYRLEPAAFQEHVEQAETAARKEFAERGEQNTRGRTSEDQLFMRHLGDSLIRACYEGASLPTGEQVDLTLDELLKNTLDDADVVNLRAHATGIHRGGSLIPFGPESFGRSATS